MLAIEKDRKKGRSIQKEHAYIRPLLRGTPLLRGIFWEGKVGKGKSRSSCVGSDREGL